MWKRLVPALLGLGAGFVVLCAGLVALHGIFVEERDEGLRALAASRSAAERFGHQSLTDALRAKLQQARARAALAARDPLANDAGLFLVEDGRVVVPRAAAPREGAQTPALELLERLQRDGPGVIAAGLEEDDPFRERLLRVDAFLDALGSKRTPDIETSFRALLTHRARFVLPVAKDFVSTLFVLQRFEEEGSPDRTLLRALAREGLGTNAAAAQPGLQRQLLLRSDQFSRADFDGLARELIAFCERAHVEYVDFRERVDAAPSVAPEVSLPVTAPLLVPGGWYVEGEGASDATGIKAELAPAVHALQTDMIRRGILEEGDALRFDLPAFPIALSEWPLSLKSPGASERMQGLDARYRAKSALLALCALFALTIVGLAVIAQQRKLRFVQVRSDFVSTVSHELRTPLSAIRVMAETLEKRVGGAPGAGDYPSRIVAETDGLSRLVENILTFNRLEKGRFDARREAVELFEVVTRIVSEVAQQRGTAIESDATPLSGVTVRGDPELLKILFANLVHNACRYGARAPVVLGWSCAPAGTGLAVHVTDNGIGIDRKDWERIFEEFRRLPAQGAQAQGGSGLGLAICRRIMTLHGGALRVARSTSEGTTFELQFPSA